MISSHDGALRDEEMATGHILRVNQENVRKIPACVPYEEVDPIPEVRKITDNSPPLHSVPIPPPSHNTQLIPEAAILHQPVGPDPEWTGWLDYVFTQTH